MCRASRLRRITRAPIFKDHHILPENKLFCFGYGYVAQALARDLKLKDKNFTIGGTTRDLDKMRQLRRDGIDAHLFDEEHPLADPLMILKDTTHLLLSIPPDDQGDPAFVLHAEDILRIPSIQWIGLLSSTAVYGDRDGGVVDENSEVRPTNKRGSRRALAEQQWLSLYETYNMPVHIFRLAGIYGPGRSALDAVRAGNSRRISKPGHAFSRIHVDDIVQTLEASMHTPHPGGIYNLADDGPSPSHEVIAYACAKLGLMPGPIIPFEQADMAPMARSFYLDNKRIDASKIKRELGVTLMHPDFRSGIDACLEAERAHAGPLSFFRTGADSD